MTLTNLTVPAAEPVTVAEARERLRLDSSESDAAIGQFIASARRRVEAMTGLRLITQQVRLTLDSFPPQIWLPVGPLQAVERILYTDASGAEQVLAPDQYRRIGARQPERLAPVYGQTWPVTRCDFDAVRVELRLGFGDGASDVPADIRQAVFLLCAHEYRMREAVAEAPGAEIPLGARALLMPHRIWS